MFPALLETIGALSLLVSIAAKIVLLRDPHEDSADDTLKAAPVRRACATCFRRKPVAGTCRSRYVRPVVSARCVRAAAGRAAFSRTRKHG
ncbi:hypothetical protein BTHE68_69260 (plasmid) [Burkholderia sp. THE68]|nr:hypothetical protein BTHE68_69260 [Burkholderia sp. THE68]